MSETNFLLEALKEFEQKVVQAAKDNLTKQNTSGDLSKSIKGDVKQMPNSIRVFFEMNEYGFYQDEGVKGANPSALPKGSKNYGKQKAPNSRYRFGSGKGQRGGLTKSLDKWIVRKGVFNSQIRDKKGKFMSRKTLKYLMARSIYLTGIKPTFFFTKPFEEAYKQLPEELIEKYGLDMENLLLSIIDENFKQYYG